MRDTGAIRPPFLFAMTSGSITVSKPIYTSAADAEAAFYDALAHSDLDKMMTVWAEDEEVVCIHPGGPRIAGLAAVRDIWRQLFASGSQLRVSIEHTVVSANPMAAVHSVYEHIGLEGDMREGPTIVATNAYIRGALGWRMVLHHASPMPALPDRGDAAPRVVH